MKLHTHVHHDAHCLRPLLTLAYFLRLAEQCRFVRLIPFLEHHQQSRHSHLETLLLQMCSTVLSLLVSHLFFRSQNICFGYLLESPQWGDSNKYPKHMFRYLWKALLYDCGLSLIFWLDTSLLMVFFYSDVQFVGLILVLSWCWEVHLYVFLRWSTQLGKPYMDWRAVGTFRNCFENEGIDENFTTKKIAFENK